MLEVKHKIKLTTGQQNWYVKKRALMKDKMFAEFPSFLEECFQTSIEGSYFANEIQRVYVQNRITQIPHDASLEVDTWWDLGMNDFTVILLTQTTKGGQIRFIDMYWSHRFRTITIGSKSEKTSWDIAIETTTCHTMLK